MQGDSVNAYDRVSYASRAFPQTHPERLATLATLFGLHPAPVAQCRVLELGCGDGANLIPMAYALPASRFVGIDLAAAPIARGQTTIGALRLSNISLQQLDVMHVHAELGEFDYIIAHGLYSWVPRAIQDKILAICKAHLAPAGVAYLSYNTYPGGHLRDLVRGMMRYHVQQVGAPDDQVGEARSLLEFLANAQPETDVYGKLLQVELKRISDNSENYVFHDDLAEINTPVYFHELIARAAEHELQYLAEADYFEMQDSTFAPAVAQTLRHVAGGERILLEQYADFLKCRKFRQTLLCHRAQQVTEIADLMQFQIASSASINATAPETEPANAALEFRDKHGQAMKTNHPLLKAAMQCLADAWPGALPFNELLARAQQCAKLAPAADTAGQLSELLLKVYGRNLVSLHVHPPSVVTRCGARPRASALARLQSAEGMMVTNLRHENVELTGRLAGRLLRLLDGTRTREKLIAELSRTLGVEQPTHSPDALPATVAADLETKLTELARLALIEA